MSEGIGYKLHVKHATKDEWSEVGPCVDHWGFFQFKNSVEAMQKQFQSFGLETRIEKFPVEYDDR